MVRGREAILDGRDALSKNVIYKTYRGSSELFS